ncbi:hypothetical protein IJM16_04750 [Candidatus Saccharibacteria bacterium]|nr:hypothetical protein [Candidatus Saccharibacteria bacterium]
MSEELLKISDVVYSYTAGAKKNYTLEDYLENVARLTDHCVWNPAQYANIAVIGMTEDEHYYILNDRMNESIGALMMEHRDKKLEPRCTNYAMLKEVFVHNMEFTGHESLLLNATVEWDETGELDRCVLHPKRASLTLPELYLFICTMRNLGMLKTDGNGAGRLLERYDELFAKERAKTEAE